MRFRLLPPRRPRSKHQQRQQQHKQTTNVKAPPSGRSDPPLHHLLTSTDAIAAVAAAANPNNHHGSARSVSSLSTGPPVPQEQGGGAEQPPPPTTLRRQMTGPFPLRSTTPEPGEESTGPSALVCPEISEEDRRIILSRLLSRRPSRVRYDVEIRAQGADDETLDGLMGDSSIVEEKKDERRHKQNLKVATSSCGILGTLRRSNSKLFLPRSYQSPHHNNDDDTLEEIMNERSVDRGEERREFSRKVRSGILELLRRSNSKILDRHELWLKASLQAIEEAQAKAFSPSRRHLQKQVLPAPIAESRKSVLQARDDDAGSKSITSKEDGQCSVATLTVSSCADSKQNQAATPKSEEKNGHAPVTLSQDSTVPTSPQEDEMSVALVEVFVHYLTCCHVLRENELQREPQGLCVHPSVGGADVAVPEMERNLHSQPKGFCVHDCGDDDDSNTYYTDDDTREDSLLLQPKDFVCNAIHSELTRSGTNGSLNDEN